MKEARFAYLPSQLFLFVVESLERASTTCWRMLLLKVGQSILKVEHLLALVVIKFGDGLNCGYAGHMFELLHNFDRGGVRTYIRQ
jgi:hypothetical protein